ncbi:hypothetical protein JCM19237_1940 [Photobacterium aphoticum]|uniref:Uncharacterized protein n=1 Tax=Photobacterium aphoticum TaxID=754436 RepID=A0A090QSW9_9GAMM|nr:hypothetical protein JCM19237_1940 [Photobacterium aphoticum]
MIQFTVINLTSIAMMLLLLRCRMLLNVILLMVLVSYSKY